MTSDSCEDLRQFEAHRTLLRGIAYRMLGDLARAEDMVQDTWLRWQRRRVAVDDPRAYLATIATRLCLTELATRRAQPLLPEPSAEPLDEEVAFAWLVALRRLSPVERAVLVLHEVCELSHDEIAVRLGKRPSAVRKQLERARLAVRDERRERVASPEEHRRLLYAFGRAAREGDVEALIAILADDAVLVSERGLRRGGVRNPPAPLVGAARIAAFVAATGPRAAPRSVREQRLNGALALVGDVALLIEVAGGRIARIYFTARRGRTARPARGPACRGRTGSRGSSRSRRRPWRAR